MVTFYHPILRAADKVASGVDGKVVGIEFAGCDDFLCHAGLAILLTMEWE